MEIITRREQRTENVKKLSALSATLRGETSTDFEKVNNLLEDFYRKELPEYIVFKSFKQWKKEGKSIKKGEHGYLFWGRPIKKEKTETTDKEEKTGNEKFYPLCYLFASNQIEIRNNN